MSDTSFSQSMFTDLCERMLRLCKVREGESLVVLSQGNERSEYVDAFLTAGQRLGAKAMNLRLPYSSSATSGEVGVWTVGKTPLSGNQPAVDILKSADMVVETLFLLFSDELTEIQEAGTRILTCIEPVDLLGRMFPTDDLARRTDVAVELLAAASTLRFTNPAGTDVTYRIGYPVKAQYGFVDQPGQWDHWPSGGMVLTCGADDGIDGRVVVDRGDILLPFKQYVHDADRVHDRGGPYHEHRGERLPGGSRQARTSPTSTTPTRTDSPTSAGASTSGRSGRRSRPTTAATGWSSVPSTATSSSRRGRTTSSAARTTRAATSTSRCATAACGSTTGR